MIEVFKEEEMREVIFWFAEFLDDFLFLRCLVLPRVIDVCPTHFLVATQRRRWVG